LTDKNFEETIKSVDCLVVKFYTKWCYYCRLLAPEYDKLFDHYEKTRPDIKISRIELDVNERVKFKYQIFSFPRLVIFHSKSDIVRAVYANRRTYEDIAEWIDQTCPKAVSGNAVGDNVKIEGNDERKFMVVDTLKTAKIVDKIPELQVEPAIIIITENTKQNNTIISM